MRSFAVTVDVPCYAPLRGIRVANRDDSSVKHFYLRISFLLLRMLLQYAIWGDGEGVAFYFILLFMNISVKILETRPPGSRQTENGQMKMK